MNPPRILISEDEIMVARDLEQRLLKFGYQVADIVDTGEEAVQKAATLHPDLVLMDIRLSGEMDGIAAAAQIRSACKTPVVFITAYADPGTLERAGVSEPFGYLLKPFEEQALHAAIEMAFYRHRAESRLRDMERWLATTLRSIGDGVIATDETGHITFLNPVAERLSQALAQLQAAFEREKRAAADISHELRTPLAALTTTIEVACRKPRLAEQYKQTLEECRAIRAQTGVVLNLAAKHPVLWICPIAMILLCALGGIIPAVKAYRTPVAETLAPLS